MFVSRTVFSQSFLTLDPTHVFYVLLGTTKDPLDWKTQKTSVKTSSQLKMASPAIPWTQREGTLMTASWQRMSASLLSESSSRLADLFGFTPLLCEKFSICLNVVDNELYLQRPPRSYGVEFSEYSGTLFLITECVRKCGHVCL